MKKVLTFGSFDILHKGHEHYLQEAKSHGDYLVVVIARDSNIVKFKGRKAKHDENYRLTEVSKLDFVDEVILGHEKDIFEVLSDVKPDVICLGYDQSTATEDKIHSELEKRGLSATIIRASSFKPEVYKSSKLRENA